MPDPTPTPEYLVKPSDGPLPRHKITTIGQLFGFLQTCPHAQTLEAYSATYKCTVWIALPCKQWKCRHCANLKIKRLSIKTEQAKPNRLLTLTVDPALWDNPRAAFDGTRRQVPECMRHLRKRFGSLEYLRVTELTKRGWPHYHLMVRSPYIPYEVVKKLWNKLTGATIVDIRQIKGRLNTYSYLVKYLSKMHRIGWTERHVSYSRGFFPPDPDTKPEGLDLADSVIIEAHPSTYIYSRFRGANLTALGINVYALDPDKNRTLDLEDPEPWTTAAVIPDQHKHLPSCQTCHTPIRRTLFPPPLHPPGEQP